MSVKIEREIRYFKSMMRSCYAYNSLSKDEKYLQKYKESLGLEAFNELYDEESTRLKNTYRVVSGTHTDHEGVTYNTLEEINKS